MLAACKSLIAKIVRRQNPQYFDIREFARFCCVGLANTALDFCVFMIASSWLAASPSRVIAWVVAGVFSYVLNKGHVFHSQSRGAKPVIRFALVNLFSLLLGLACLELFLFLGYGRLAAYVVTLPAIALGNYFGYKLWSFK
ncbi:MAG: GtrA family protein [Desulfovibrio sp.]|nr:GtrA family protein [Desulfovibrio sp.]